MRILFTADWHIKLGQKNVPEKWQANRFRELYKLLLELDYDMHIIGGDIFDSIPSLKELKLFCEFLLKIDRPTLIFDGNHEATKKGHTFFESLAIIFESLNTHVEVIRGSVGLKNIDIIPYTDIKTFNPYEFDNDILFTHVRGEITPHVKPEIDLTKLDRWKIVFAGDLHSHSNSQRNIIYPGSPMTVTFHRNTTHTGAILLDSETKQWEWVKLDLPQLVRKTVTREEDMVETYPDHTIYELSGDIQELAKVNKTSPLLDKKIVKRNVDATIDFSKVNTIEEELLLYLKEVKLVEDTDRILKRFNDNI